MRARASFFVLLALVACSSEQAPSPAVATPEGDPEDVFCDPVDGLAADDAPAAPTSAPLVRFVDPFVGTGGAGFGTGTTYPGPQTPFGMAKPGPDTSRGGRSITFSHCSGYAYSDDTIEGFSHARLHGAGIADYGNVALMPMTAFDPNVHAKPRSHGAKFAHADETASPGAYAVTLATGVRVELTASDRVAVHRYTFPAGPQHVTVDVGHVLAEGTAVKDAAIAIDPATHEVTGHETVDGGYSSRFGGARLYFALRFDRAPTTSETYAGGVASAAPSATGRDAGAHLVFDEASPTLVAHVGLSFVDIAHARANLDVESAPFDTIRAATEERWEQRLSVLALDARSDRDRRVAYTALYHAALMPTLASDVDGGYRGIDGQVHQADFRYFTDFSLWDTYRTLHSLVTLLYPADARDFAKSLTRMAEESGFVPRWPLATGETGGMVGDGGTIVLADTWLRGVREWDVEAAYAVMRTQATTPRESRGREGIADYMALGYVPKDSGSATAAKTLEYAHADHALGELARDLGKTADADLFLARGKSWGNVFDDERHVFSGRSRDGSFVIDSPTAMSKDFSEGTSWHYAFMVPHDIESLAARMGRDRFVAKAEQLFTRAACNPNVGTVLPNPHYWPSNEPVLFSSFAFSAVGDRERTARWSRWTTLTHYGDGPDGLPGNDDSGTMSAHYLFSALGLYPIAGTDRWLTGSPLFPRATLALPGGPLVIEAPAATNTSRFPKSVTKNGQPVGQTLRHSDLANATLHFDLTPEPSPTAKLPPP